MSEEAAPSPAPEAPSAGLQIEHQAPTTEPQNVAKITESGAVETPMGDAPTEQPTELIGGKFKSQEDLLKGYQELEKKLGTAKTEFAESNVDDILRQAGLQPDELALNYKADGKLSDEQYQKLKDVGWSKSVVDSFLQGQVAIAQNSVYAQAQIQANAEKMAGGKEQLEGLMRWAGTNLDEGRVAELNTRLGSPSTYESALKELMFDYQLASGQPGARQGEILSGQAMPNVSKGFDSVNEMITALGKAREQGYFDETFKRRMANTPKNIVNGMDTR